MNRRLVTIIIAAGWPILTTIQADYETYKAAKKADPTTEFEWPTLTMKVVRSLWLSASAAVGVNLVLPEGE